VLEQDYLLAYNQRVLITESTHFQQIVKPNVKFLHVLFLNLQRIQMFKVNQLIAKILVKDYLALIANLIRSKMSHGGILLIKLLF